MPNLHLQSKVALWSDVRRRKNWFKVDNVQPTDDSPFLERRSVVEKDSTLFTSQLGHHHNEHRLQKWSDSFLVDFGELNIVNVFDK